MIKLLDIEVPEGRSGMRMFWGYWRPWDQTQAIVNARGACTELSQRRADREEVDLYLARHFAVRRG